MKPKQEKKIEHFAYPKTTSLMIVFAIIMLSFLILRNEILPPEIPLYYGATIGNEQLGSSLEIILPTIISLTIIIVNLSIAYLSKELFIKKVLTVTALSCLVISSITTIKILLLVGNL